MEYILPKSIWVVWAAQSPVVMILIGRLSTPASVAMHQIESRNLGVG